MTTDRGHRSRPHTADTIIEAWGPDLAGCLSEAAIGLIEEFTRVGGNEAGTERELHVSAPDVDRLLVALLDELLFLIDAEGLVPVQISVTNADETGCRGTMRLVPIEAVEQIGAAPKSVSLSGLRVERSPRGWSCQVLIDT